MMTYLTQKKRAAFVLISHLFIFFLLLFPSASPAAETDSKILAPLYSLLLNPSLGPLRFSTTSPLKDGTLGQYYSQTIQVRGGTTPYSWAISGGSLLPPGLSLQLDTGTIKGTPLAVATSTPLVRVIDTDGTEITQAFSLTIKPISESGSPAPPSDLQTAPTGPTTIVMTWNDNSSNEDFFEIERSPDVLHFSYYDKWSGSPSIQDIGLTQDTHYCYRIRAHNSSGDSSYSNISCSWTNATTEPRAPTNLTAQAISDDTILLTWTNNSQSDSYRVYESVDGGDYSLAGSVPDDNVPGAYIPGVSAGHTYSYKISAHNNFGYSSDGTESNAVTTPGAAAYSVQITNNTSYPIISLKIDGLEQFPSAPQGIPPGGSHEVAVASGSHNYQVSNGFWDGNSRFSLYNWNLSSSSSSVNINNPSIYQLLTKFSASGYYLGETWVGTSFHYQGFRFYSNGTYAFYKDNIHQGNGTYSLNSYPGSYTVTFQVLGNQNATGYYDELAGSFYMQNGPPDWPSVKYLDAGN